MPVPRETTALLGVSIAPLVGVTALAQDITAPLTVNGDPGGTGALRVNGSTRITQQLLVGTDPGGSELVRVGGGADIKGTIRTKEVVVTLTGWADDVLAKGYPLPALSEVEKGIAATGHLSGIPAERDLMAQGLPIGDMQRMHMAKIEELTLYAIDADKRLAAAEARYAEKDREARQLKAQVAAVAARLARIEIALAASAPAASAPAAR